MSRLVERLVDRILSGDTPESEIMALGSSDLEELASGMERNSGEIEDLRRVLDVLEEGNGESSAYSRGLSFATALELGALPGARAIVAQLRQDQPGMPALRIFGASRVGDGGRIVLQAERKAAIQSLIAELNGLFVHLPAEVSLEVSNGKVASYAIAPITSAALEEVRSLVESLHSRGAIGFSDPLPPGVSHHVLEGANGRRYLEQLSF